MLGAMNSHQHFQFQSYTTGFNLVSFPYLYSLSQIRRSLSPIIHNVFTNMIGFLYITNLLLLLSTSIP